MIVIVGSNYYLNFPVILLILDAGKIDIQRCHVRLMIRNVGSNYSLIYLADYMMTNVGGSITSTDSNNFHQIPE